MEFLTSRWKKFYDFIKSDLIWLRMSTICSPYIRHWLILCKRCVEFFHLSSALSQLSRWHGIPFSRHKQHRVWEDLCHLMNREWLGQSTNKFENAVDGTKILQQPTTFTSHRCKRQTKNYLSKMRPIARHESWGTNHCLQQHGKTLMSAIGKRLSCILPVSSSIAWSKFINIQLDIECHHHCSM